MTGLLLQELGPVLEHGNAHELLPAVCARLESVLGVRAQTWLVDYRQQSLRSTSWSHENSDGPQQEQPVEGSLIGRSFAGQVPLLQRLDDEVVLILPLVTRGERHGVLELRFTEAPDEQLRAELDALAPLIAQALSSLGTVSGPHERARRSRPLTVAAEIQWSLLPRTGYGDADVTAAGLLEPAYSVAGDAFDWTRDEDIFHTVVLDGTGRGVPAALATALALGALRNARFAGVSLSDQAALADQAVYAHHGGESFVSALLFQFDLSQGRLRVVDAGSPQLYRVRDGRGALIELEAQLPLGMFDETIYREQEIDVLPGDRFVIVSDGVHGTQTRTGADFGDSLLGVFRECRLLSVAETARFVLRKLREEHHDGGLAEGLTDDALVVCVDVHPS